MTTDITPQAEIVRYRLEIRDENGKLIRIEEFEAETGETRITHVTD
jgi:hypothetical protein